MKFNPKHPFMKSPAFAAAMCLAFLLLLTDDCLAQRPPAKVFGEYRGAGCTANNKSGCLPTGKNDRVRIFRATGGKSSIRVNMIFEQGHTCALEGEAIWSKNSFILNAEGIDPQKPCRLTVRIRGSILTLEDAGGNCREVYCGVRGAFHGARFRKI